MAQTTDGGRAWHRAVAPADHLDGLKFVTSKDGWAWGPGLFVTHDGGKTWADQSPAGDVLSLDAKDGVAWTLVNSCPGGVSCPHLLRLSLDLGKTWSDSFTSDHFFTLDMTEGVMWLFERECPNMSKIDPPKQCTFTLHTSADKGKTWQQPAVQPPILGTDMQLVRLNLTDALVFSENAYKNTPARPTDYATPHHDHYLILTRDGGRMWQTRPHPCSSDFSARAAGLLSGQLWLSCNSEEYQGFSSKTIYVSDDRGLHWDLRANSRHGLSDMYGVSSFGIISQNRAWLAYSRYGVSFTYDGGYTWKGAGINDGGGGGMGPMLFIDAKHGWFGCRWQIYRTVDGGVTWEPAEVSHPTPP